MKGTSGSTRAVASNSSAKQGTPPHFRSALPVEDDVFTSPYIFDACDDFLDVFLIFSVNCVWYRA